MEAKGFNEFAAENLALDDEVQTLVWELVGKIGSKLAEHQFPPDSDPEKITAILVSQIVQKETV